MRSVNLNSSWNVVSEGVDVKCDLPYDALVDSARDFACSMGEFNGYHPAKTAVFRKQLPQVRAGKAVLVISGACGYGDLFVNDELIGSISSYAPARFDLTGKLAAPKNTLEFKAITAPEMSDKYIGLGIAGGVTLETEEELDIVSDSLFVTTAVENGKTYADAHVTVRNDGAAQKLLLECTAYSPRGKRAGKKQRKIFMRSGTVKTFTVRVRINKPYEWTPADPYMYGMTARILGVPAEDGKTASVRFGLVTRALGPRGLYINGKNTLLMGAFVSHADAAIGAISNYSNEVRRFKALKELGYNAVHFVGCPCAAALDALDDIGMYAFVDIFATLKTAKAPLDGHMFFTDGLDEAAASVKAMRNHPCVALYGVADDVPECYDRNGGHAVIKAIADRIRALDATRLTTVSTREQVPTAAEFEAAGIRKHFENEAAKISAGREKDMFNTLTHGAFAAVDVCGFNYLSSMYAAEKNKLNRVIVGTRTSSERAFESLDETEKNSRVIGDFNECGIDYPGGGKLNEVCCTLGDLDAICDVKPSGEYKRILLGERGKSFITVLDPDTDAPVAMWNWTRYLGQPVTVKVYTVGDVVALYLDGKLLGRKLAGKVNRHTATFNVDFYPGTLEAVSYFKGTECSRTVLKSAQSPKTIRLSATDKNLLLSRGDLGFVHIDVCDRDGNLVPYAMRTLAATVTGGTIVGFINADPMLRKPAFDECPAFGGHALCVIKPDPSEDRAVVKITGDGLLAAKITFKIKD